MSMCHNLIIFVTYQVKYLIIINFCEVYQEAKVYIHVYM